MPPPLTDGFALGLYGTALGATIRRAKYACQPRLLVPPALRLASGLRESSFDVVVPVPSSPSHHWRRAFDPADIVAREIAATLRRPLLHVLRRREAPAQASQTDRSRHHAARDALSIDERPMGPRHVLLVDDVMTSGATAAAAATLLLSQGALSVRLAAIAHRDARATVS